MKRFCLPGAVCFLFGCAQFNEIPDHKIPVNTLYDLTNLVVFKTDSLRIIEATERAIAYEYNDQHVNLAQVGDHATRFCEGKGRYTVLVNMILTNRHNFRRAYFECKPA